MDVERPIALVAKATEVKDKNFEVGTRVIFDHEHMGSKLIKYKWTADGCEKILQAMPLEKRGKGCTCAWSLRRS